MTTFRLSIPHLLRAYVAVIGFGRSGQSATDFLLEHGCVPTVYTQGTVPSATKEKYQPNGVRFFDFFPDCFSEDVLIRSPGIRPDIPPIRRAVAHGAMLTGEIDLFLSLTRATVIGVTGSDGKTTTSAMIDALLRAAGKRVLLGGNNGKPLLPYAETLLDTDFAVVELSSFQLMTAPSPDVAVITNLTPNHLNWHTDFEEYTGAKCRIWTNASRLVTNAEMDLTREIGRRAALPVTWFARESPLPCHGEAVRVLGDSLHLENTVCPRTVSVFRDFLLRGAHNRDNFAAAVAATLPYVEEDTIQQAARDFRGVKHRLQHVATVNGVSFINSSIDTSPTRTAAALSALDCRPLVIAGGRGKGIDLSPLSDALVAHARAVFLYGETAKEIEKGIAGRLECGCFSHFADAFDAAARCAKRGETVLLSPGCTAFGEFRDFEERGDVFCDLVNNWKKKGKDKWNCEI